MKKTESLELKEATAEIENSVDVFNGILYTVDKKGLANLEDNLTRRQVSGKKCMLKYGETRSRKYRCNHKKHRGHGKNIYTSNQNLRKKRQKGTKAAFEEI